MKNLIRIFLTTCLLMIAATVACAQPGLPQSPEQTPLGGIGILAAAGGAYAIKKLREKKK